MGQEARLRLSHATFEMPVRYQAEHSRKQIDKSKASIGPYGACANEREGLPFLQANVASYQGTWLGEQSTAVLHPRESLWP